MMSEKEPEQILEQVFDLLRELEKCKVKAERPIPIVKDRQGRLAKDLTVKEWFCKLNEELDELKYDLVKEYNLSRVPGKYQDILSQSSKKDIVGELCDVIEVLYSMASQMGIDGDVIQQGIHDTNEKLKERGCI
jgi:hypothetical protein